MWVSSCTGTLITKDKELNSKLELHSVEHNYATELSHCQVTTLGSGTASPFMEVIIICCRTDWFTGFLPLPTFANVIAEETLFHLLDYDNYYFVNFLVKNTIIVSLLFYLRLLKAIFVLILQTVAYLDLSRTKGHNNILFIPWLNIF